MARPKHLATGALVQLIVVLALGLAVPVLQATENDLPAPVAMVRQLSASVNTRRLANVLDDEFVSFSAKPQDIFDGQGNPICETSFLMAQSLGRTFLKVVADSSQLHLQTESGRSVIGAPDDAGLVQIKASAWQAFYDWAHRAGIVPVFVLDYPTDGLGAWDARRTLQVLSAASGLGIEECRWQLGNGNVRDGPRYWEDLRTFRTMLRAFPKQRWGVVACELSPDGALEDIQFFHVNIDSLVDAVSISKPLYGEAAWNYSTLQRDVHLRGLAKQRPARLWLDLVDEEYTRADNGLQGRAICDERCLRQGLEYARTLGEAARGGVSAVFKPVQRASIQQYTLDYLTALLYKRTVGSKVFPVQHQQQQQQQDPLQHPGTSVYAYCTRNVTGSVTLVVVNEAQTEATNVTIRLMTRAPSSPVDLFLVSVQNGQPMVNNRAFPDGSVVPELVPVTAVTTLANGVSFYVPAQTILFAVVPGVQVRECRLDVNPSPKWRPNVPEPVQREPTSSTDALLQELIGALLEQSPLEPLQRRRRSAVSPSDSPRRTERALLAGREKRKRAFPRARVAGAPQDGDLAESLAKAIAQAHPDLAPTERSVRGPRQTQAYRRQQRRVRHKEKRAEQRHLLRMKHPLLESHRERSKRGGGQQMLMRRNARHHHPHHRFHERLLKRMSAKLASRKTKRSSLAEAVNDPPSFGASEEDQQGRSGFPLGDVHLVISKTADGGAPREHPLPLDSDEVEPLPDRYRKLPDGRRASRHRPGVRRRISINQRDFYRGFGMDRTMDRPLDSDEADCKYRRTYRRGKGEEEEEHAMEAKETKRIDRYFPIAVGRSEQDEDESHESIMVQPDREDDGEEETGVKRSQERREQEGEEREDEEEEDDGFPTGQPRDERDEGEDEAQHQGHEEREDERQESAQSASSEHTPQEDTRRDMVDRVGAVSEEMQLFTPAPRTSAERPKMPWDETPPQWSLESTSAEVAELMHRRYKRSADGGSEPRESVESREVQRLEDFFRTNAKLQQKFAEMFDLLLEAIEELESEENDAREDEDDEGDDEGAHENEAHHRRTKRNALLHPQSWESRERSNMIQQARREEESVEESKENQVIPVAVRMPRDDSQPSGTDTAETSREHETQPAADAGDGKPGAFMLRSVVNFVRRATSEFHQLFSGWFQKAS